MDRPEQAQSQKIVDHIRGCETPDLDVMAMEHVTAIGVVIESRATDVRDDLGNVEVDTEEYQKREQGVAERRVQHPDPVIAPQLGRSRS